MAFLTVSNVGSIIFFFQTKYIVYLLIICQTRKPWKRLNGKIGHILSLNLNDDELIFDFQKSFKFDASNERKYRYWYSCHAICCYECWIMGKILIKRKKCDKILDSFVYIEKCIKHIYRETNFLFTIAHTHVLG